MIKKPRITTDYKNLVVTLTIQILLSNRVIGINHTCAYLHVFGHVDVNVDNLFFVYFVLRATRAIQTY